MPVTIKSAMVKYKNSNGEYIGVNALAETTTASQIAAITQAGASEVSAITQKGVETRASIPDDYTALSDEVGDLMSALEPLENAFVGDILSLSVKTESAYYSTNGVRHESSNWISYFIPSNKVSKITLVKSYSATSLTTYQVMFLKENDAFDSGIYFSNASELNTLENVSIPETCITIVISNRITSGNAVAEGFASESVSEMVTESYNKSKDYADNAIETYSDKTTSKIAFDKCFMSKNRMLFSAHRGAEGQAPYGSYPSYKLACEQGWDIIQIAQARQSADGTWYCIHDDSVDAQTNGTGNIAELTDAYLDTIYQDVGENVSQYTPEQLKLPKLEDVLQLAYRYGLMVSIRMGSLPANWYGDNRAPWNSFIALVSKYRPETMIFSGTFAQANCIKYLTQNWHTQIYTANNDVQDVINAIISNGWTNVSVMSSVEYMNDYIETAHASGIYCASSQILDNPTVDDFIVLSNKHYDQAQTGLSNIHSLAD